MYKPSTIINSEHGKQDQSDGHEYNEECGWRLLHPASHRLDVGRHGGDGPVGGGGDGVHTDGARLLVENLPHLTLALGDGVLGGALVNTGPELHTLVTVTI